MEPTALNRPPLIAAFRPQTWRDDQTVDGTPVTFDATGAFLRRSLYEIRTYRPYSYDSDYLAEYLPERREHTGPFEVDCDVDAWLAFYGIEDRTKMSEADLSNLRTLWRINSDKPKSPPTTSTNAACVLSGEQVIALQTYLVQDQEMHLAAPHGRWRLDLGKLIAALEFVGVTVVDTKR